MSGKGSNRCAIPRPNARPAPSQSSDKAADKENQNGNCHNKAKEKAGSRPVHLKGPFRPSIIAKQVNSGEGFTTHRTRANSGRRAGDGSKSDDPDKTPEAERRRNPSGSGRGSRTGHRPGEPSTNGDGSSTLTKRKATGSRSVLRSRNHSSDKNDGSGERKESHPIHPKSGTMNGMIRVRRSSDTQADTLREKLKRAQEDIEQERDHVKDLEQTLSGLAEVQKERTYRDELEDENLHLQDKVKRQQAEINTCKEALEKLSIDPVSLEPLQTDMEEVQRQQLKATEAAILLRSKLEAMNEHNLNMIPALKKLIEDCS